MPRLRGGGATDTLQLRLLDREQRVETLFVAVAGVGTKATKEWGLTSVQAPGIGLYSFDHNISKSDPNFWQSFSEHGQNLLQSLLRLIDNQRLQHCPILLVGHSLGGLVIKETLRLAYERTGQQYRPFKKALAGVILMGTPHSISEEEVKWQNVAFLPHLTGYTFKIQPLNRDSIQKLTRSSLQFDQSGVICPILTVCEKRLTKVKLRFGSQRIQLVDSTFAQTGSREERCIEVDSDHKNLCDLYDNTEIQNFIAEVLEDARLHIASDSPLSGTEADELGEEGYDMAEYTSEPTSTTLLHPFTNSATAGSSDLGFELVGEMASNLQLGPPVLPCYLIPVARNKDFFGRQDVIEQIGTFLSSIAVINDEAPEHSKSFALCGPGGIGKTQIVTEYAYRCREAKAFDAIFWIYADTATKLAEGIAQIATSLQLVEADSPEALDPVITVNLTKEWLSNPARPANIADDHSNVQPRWLLILDNVDDLGVLEGLWPIEGPGCVLVTSRDPLAKEPTVLAEAGYDVNSFSSEESSEMLVHLTKRTGDGKAVGERLGGLPLAIVQMASIIIRNHMSFEDFVGTWDERQEHPEYLGAESKLMAPDTYNKSPSTVWTIDSLRHGKQLLEVMAFYDPDCIQEPILKQYSNIPLENYPTKLGDYLKARKELLQTSLARKDVSEKNLSVHRIIQDATRSRMGKAHYHVAFTAALHLLSSVWPFEAFGWRHGVARWRECEELFPHVLRLKALGSPIVNELEDFETKTQYCKLMSDAGWFYHETGHFTESQNLIEHAYEVASATQSALSRTTSNSSIMKELDDIIAETHHNLGCIGTETNQPEFTLVHFRKFNEMMSERADENVPDTINRLAISWNELGNAYMMNKLWLDGERCFKQCLETAQEVEGFSPAEFSFPYVNLGLAYWLTNRLDLAQATLEEGLRYREATYGIDDTQSFITGRFLYALANVTESQGQWEDSFTYHQRALQQFLSTIGKNHHRTGDVRMRVAQHFFRKGQFDQASKQIDGALAIFRVRATFRPEMARVMFWKSKIVEATGDADKARKLRDESLDMYRDITQKAVSADCELEEAFDDLIAFWSR